MIICVRQSKLLFHIWTNNIPIAVWTESFGKNEEKIKRWRIHGFSAWCSLFLHRIFSFLGINVWMVWVDMVWLIIWSRKIVGAKFQAIPYAHYTLAIKRNKQCARINDLIFQENPVTFYRVARLPLTSTIRYDTDISVKRLKKEQRPRIISTDHFKMRTIKRTSYKLTDISVLFVTIDNK